MAHIIIADDDPIVVEMVRGVLESEGHVVGAVEDGQSALAAISAKQPDLVILDCAMPNLPGIDVLRRMRGSAVLGGIPVMMLTARRGRQDVQVAYYSGADAYLKKPIDPDELIFWVEELLAAGRKASPACSE
jgi:DNA-binding response OmpR family regulator